MKLRGIALAALIAVLFTFGLAQAQAPEVTSGVGYLSGAQNADGSWGSVSSSTDALTATAQAIEALRDLELTSDASYSDASAWLGQQDLNMTRQFAQRILALATAGSDAQALTSTADALSYAWGGYEGYETNTLDTALAMQALESAGAMDQETLSYALYYLFTSQNSEGGWGFTAGGPGNTYITALVSLALEPYAQYVDTANALEQAKGYLVAHQNSDGGFGSSPSTVYETALGYMALVGQTTDETVLGNAVNYLKSTQAADGSWDGDPYQTALALRALKLAEANPAEPEEPVDGGVLDPTEPPPGTTFPPGTTLFGYVTDAQTGEPVEGVEVVTLFGRISVTDANGFYAISGINGNDGFDGYVSGVPFVMVYFKARATGYNTQTLQVMIKKDEATSFNISLQPSDPITVKSFKILGLDVEKASYASYEDVQITSIITNEGESEETVLVKAEILDEEGNILAVAAPSEPYITLGASGVSETTAIWNTAQYAPGKYTVRLKVLDPDLSVYDPNSGTASYSLAVIAERETYLTIVPTSMIIGSIKLDPPVSQVDLQQPISITAAVRNSGNEPVEAGFTLSVSLDESIVYSTSSLPVHFEVNEVEEFDFGSFVPQQDGTYTVTLTPVGSNASSDIQTELLVGAHAKVTFTVEPEEVVIGDAEITGTIHLEGVGKLEGSSQDPRVPLIKDAIQKGVNYQQEAMLTWHRTNNCNGCHVQGQALVGLEYSRKYAEVDDAATGEVMEDLIASQLPNGAITKYFNGGGGFESSYTTTFFSLWGLTAWHDQEAIRANILSAADFLLANQETSGYWMKYGSYLAKTWWVDERSMTSLAMISIAHAYKISGDAKYLDSLKSASRYLLDELNNYFFIGSNSKHTMRIAQQIIGLSAVKDIIDDEALQEQVAQALQDGVQKLKDNQRSDGSWGRSTLYESGDSMVTAQVLYALIQAGASSYDPAVNTAIDFLLDHQDEDGSWESENIIMDTRHAATTWVMIALPIGLERVGSVDAEVHVEFPSDIKLDSSTPSPTDHVGAEYVWNVLRVSEEGKAIELDLTARDLGLHEIRHVARNAYVVLENSMTGGSINIPIAIPFVYSRAPFELNVETDKEAYSPNEDVEVSVDISNLSTSTMDSELHVSVVDSAGNEVAHLGDALIADLEPVQFAGLDYRMPVSVTWEQSALNTPVKIDIDVATGLYALGLEGQTIDIDSIRVAEVDNLGNVIGERSASAGYLDNNTIRIILVMNELIAANETRHFYVHFNTEQQYVIDRFMNENAFIAASDDEGRVYTIEAFGDGTFGPSIVLDDITVESDGTRGIAIEDFNNDGFMDIVTGSAATETLYYYQNKADGSNTFESRQEIGFGFGMNEYVLDIAAGNFNADNNMDFMVSGNTRGLYLYYGNGNGTFSRRLFSNYNDKHIAKDSHDMDLDGIDDLVVTEGSNLYLYRGGEPSSTFYPRVKVAYLSYTNSITLGDFDNDGIPDIIAHTAYQSWWTGKWTINTYFIKGNGNLSFSSPVKITHFPFTIAALDSGDFNGDGNLDIVASGSNVVRFAPGNGDGTFGQFIDLLQNDSTTIGVAAPRIPVGLSLEVGAPEVAPRENYHFTWNTGATLAGDYRVHAMLTDNGELVAEDNADFTILPDATVSSRIYTDKAQYSADDDVAISASVSNSGSNALYENLTARITVKEDDTVRYTEEKPVSLLVPGQTVDLKTYWNTEEHEKGTYTVSITVLEGAEVLSTSSANFEILGSRNTGRGLKGTLSASPNLVRRGEDVSLSYTIENQGNEDITELDVRVIVVNPLNRDDLETLETTVALAQDTTLVDSFTAETGGLGSGIYVAVLQAQSADMAKAKVLDFSRFEVESPTVEAEKGFSERRGHVLVWLNYNWTSSSEQQALPDVGLVESALQAAGVNYYLVYDKKDFQAELRSPFYTDYVILGDHHPLEDHYADSLREKVFSGRGLISSMFKRHSLDGPVFGMKVTGYLKHGDYPVELADSDISAAGLTNSTGRSLRAEAYTPDEVVAWVLEDTKKGTKAHPAIVQHSYGLGNVLFYGFDLGLSMDDYGLFETLVVNSLNYVHQPEDYSGMLHPYQLVPVELKLKSLGDTLTVRVEETYPGTMSIFDPVTAQWVVDTPWTFDITLNEDEERGVTYYALTPDLTGTFTLTSSVGIVDDGDVAHVLDADIALSVKDTYTLTTDVLDALYTLEVSPEEQYLLDEAIAYVQSAQSRPVLSAEDINSNIHDVLMAIKGLLQVSSVDTTELIHMMDEVLEAWEGRWYFSM